MAVMKGLRMLSSWSSMSQVHIMLFWGRPTLNAFGVVVLTAHLVLTFLDANNTVVTLRGDQQAARAYYSVSLQLPPK